MSTVRSFWKTHFPKVLLNTAVPTLTPSAPAAFCRELLKLLPGQGKLGAKLRAEKLRFSLEWSCFSPCGSNYQQVSLPLCSVREVTGGAPSQQSPGWNDSREAEHLQRRVLTPGIYVKEVNTLTHLWCGPHLRRLRLIHQKIILENWRN